MRVKPQLSSPAAVAAAAAVAVACKSSTGL